MALGNVRIEGDGTFHLEATPYHQPSSSTIVESSWSYTLSLREMGRTGIEDRVGHPTNAVHRPSEASFSYDGVESEVVYEHRPDGIKLFVHISERPIGEGPVSLIFDQEGENLEFAPEGQHVVASHAGREAFRWKGLVAFDSEGSDLPISMIGEPNELRFEVDDTEAVYPITVDPLATSNG